MINNNNISDQPSPMESQTMVIDSASGSNEVGKTNQNPFQKNQKVIRSPMRSRSHSLVDYNLPNQKQNDTLPLRSETPLLHEKSVEIRQLKIDLKAACDEIKELRKQIIELAQAKKNTYSPFNTDEEEETVAKETEWLLPKNKKRKAMFSPEINVKSPNIRSKQSLSSTKKLKPPPVIVSNLENYNTINNSLQSKQIKFTNNLMNNKQLKINVETENDFRELTKFMNDSKFEWHTYENKQTRPIRVMARNLHPTCNSEDIKEDLKTKGFKVLDVTNKIKKTRIEENIVITPLPLFVLTFHNGEDIKKIYEIQYICHLKVKIEALRSNKLIPQCKKCQRFGHTQKFCQRAVKCVKCAGNHLTATCTKPTNAPPKCSNCGEPHPANYRGCLVAKELQMRRTNLVQEKKALNTQNQRQLPSRKQTNELSYAQAAQMNKNNTEKQKAPEEQTMMQMLQNILSRLDRLEASHTGAVPRYAN